MNEIMTLKEVAEYLQLKDMNMYRLLKKHQLPGFKVGSSWRFRRSDIENIGVNELKRFYKNA